jgi:hypothetical protein
MYSQGFKNRYLPNYGFKDVPMYSLITAKDGILLKYRNAPECDLEQSVVQHRTSTASYKKFFFSEHDLNKEILLVAKVVIAILQNI